MQHGSSLRVGAALLGAALVLTGPLTAGAGAQRGDSVSARKQALDHKIAVLKDQMEGTSTQYAAAAEALVRADSALQDAQDALSQADGEVRRADELLAGINEQLTFATAQEAKAQASLVAQQKAADEIRTRISQLARADYMQAGLGTVSVLLGAGTPDQFTERAAVVQVVSQSRSASLDQLAVRQAETTGLAARLLAVRQRIAALRSQAAAALVVTQKAQAVAATAQTQRATAVAQRQVAVTNLAARRKSEQANLDSMTAEQIKLKAILVARAKAWARSHHGQGPPGPSAGVLNAPARGPISSGYGMRFHPILHYWRLHSGIDFAIACGTPVYAAADGTVIGAGWAGGYGNRVMIDHGWLGGGNLVTTYNHLSRIVVHGGHVKRGQLIAYSGTTGLSTGCHLHFETLINGGFRNPANFL